MAEKQFKIPGSEIKRLVSSAIGGCWCIATDMITVQGRRIGYMYREEPDEGENGGGDSGGGDRGGGDSGGGQDSGWRFFAGDEPEAYLDDPNNAAVYEVNTIANYDPAIIPLLDSPVRSAFERRGFFTKKFVAVPFEAPADEEEERQ